jgi:hypothetical protein
MYSVDIKNILIVVFCFSSLTIGYTQSVGIGTDKSAGIASLDITSDDKGIVIPRMDSLGRTLITTPAQDLMIYQTDKSPGFYYYSGSSWKKVGDNTRPGESSRSTISGVGIGTTTPDNLLQIVGGENATLSPATGYMTIGSIPNTNMVLDQNGIQVRNNSVAGNLRLQESGGNVYIDNPEATLYVRGTEDISLTDDEGLAVFGPATGLNIAIDNNEIMARNNGNRSTLLLQNEGGNTNIGGNLQVDSLILGRFRFEQEDIYIDGNDTELVIGDNTLIGVHVLADNPTPVINLISGPSSGRIVIIKSAGSYDFILQEGTFLDLPSSSITMSGDDVIMLLYSGTKYQQLSFSNNN